ncbi:MAG: phosphotransferase [Chloroflexota bacterium]
MSFVSHFADILNHWQIESYSDSQTIQSDVFKITLNDGRQVALKDLGDENENTIQRLYFEYDVLTHVEQTGLTVAVPLIARNGKPYINFTGRIIRLSHWLPNQPQPAHTDDERIRLFQNYGRAIAQFHQALATYEDDHILERTWQASLHSRVIDQAIPTIFVYLDDAKHTWFQNLRATIEVDMITAFANLPEQLVIWDCHPGNVARDGFEVTGFVDCNHIAIAPRIFDLSNFLVNLLKWDVNDTEKSARWLAHFDQLIVGYEQVQPLTSSEKQGLFYGLIGVTLTMIDFFFQTDRPALTELEFDTVEWLVQHRSAICDQLEM